MYGVPANLDLGPFHGATLIQIRIGEFQIQFVFTAPELTISVEGAWQLENADGQLVDRSLPNEQRDSFKVHRLLGRTLVAHSVESPQSLKLTFDNGWRLAIFDDSTEYESFSIQPGDIYV